MKINKVRADLVKEKILNQIKETYESGNALHFSNTDEVLVINQKNKPYIQIKNPNKRGKYENK